MNLLFRRIDVLLLVKSLFNADDLVLLQQQLDIVEKSYQNWALAVNMNKTNIMNFQNCPR